MVRQKATGLVRVEVYVSEALAREIDRARGLVKRATWIRAVLMQELDREKGRKNKQLGGVA